MQNKNVTTIKDRNRRASYIGILLACLIILASFAVVFIRHEISLNRPIKRAEAETNIVVPNTLTNNTTSVDYQLDEIIGTTYYDWEYDFTPQTISVDNNTFTFVYTITNVSQEDLPLDQLYVCSMADLQTGEEICAFSVKELVYINADGVAKEGEVTSIPAKGDTVKVTMSAEYDESNPIPTLVVQSIKTGVYKFNVKH